MNSLDEDTGMTCDLYCSISRILALGWYMSDIAYPFYVTSEKVAEGFIFYTSKCGSAVFEPWATWMSWNLTGAEFLGTTDSNYDYLDLVAPDLNPGRGPIWTEPYYPLYGFPAKNTFF